ncbi:hypothetical protein [Micromonospora sp. NBC_01813]|uniref:hypothetical protein n=1 Tax=Micromonospora sp. NBC_01813 TaxID=2975988 RepID=UPI002DD89F61|nr:hypothetical protein [Micromonospora sp. NBC_01813]WSA11535.1 hypothetical protein OG958_12555 [Micromonospora sp. NBC_01813]
MSMMYCVTRNGARVAGSLAVPFEAAYAAAILLNREYRRREFEVEPDPTATPWEQMQAPQMIEAVRDLYPSTTLAKVSAIRSS